MEYTGDVKVKASDSLYAVGERTVQIGFEHELDNAWDYYQHGYFRAALKLIDRQLCEKKQSEWVIYPILFLCRHYIELALKSLIIEACASFIPCRQVDSAGPISILVRPLDIASEHNLLKLWDRLVSIVTANRRRPMLDDSQALRRIIAQFNEIDPSSMLTRYGLKKDLEAFSLDKIRQLSLQIFETS